MKLKVKKNYDGYGHFVENAMLLWIGKRIYPYVTSDMMSYLALCAALGMGVVAFYAGSDLRLLWLMIPGIILHGIGDGLDGKVAKLRHEERPKYGYYMDRMLDSVSFSFVFIGIHLSSLTQTDAWLFALICIQLHMAHIFLKASVTSIFDMQIGRFGGAEMKLVETVVIIGVCLSGNPVLGTFGWTLLDWIGWMVTGMLSVALFGLITHSLYGAKKICE